MKSTGSLTSRISAAYLLAVIAVLTPFHAFAQADAVPDDSLLDWYDLTEWELEGRAFAESERLRWFDRFPASAKGRVTEKVWELSRDSSGMVFRFHSDAATIWIDYSLRKDPGIRHNMSAIGASGFDLYARDSNGQWRWVSVTQPRAKAERVELVSDLKSGGHEFALYLPLRNGVESVTLGVPRGAAFTGLSPRGEKPIVFYGTSINHGASASRAGMTHIAILGRKLDRPIMNFGFAGNGRMDVEVGEYLSQIEAAVYVIDCLPNMGPDLVREKCPPFVRKLRSARPETPIVLVEDRRKPNEWIRPSQARFHDENHAALRECFDLLLAEGIQGLFYIPGDHLLGDDAEGTSDNSHPNDLGFMRQATIFEPHLREILNEVAD